MEASIFMSYEVVFDAAEASAVLQVALMLRWLPEEEVAVSALNLSCLHLLPSFYEADGWSH